MRKHKFLTKAILADFNKIGNQSDKKDPIIICKYFDPCSRWTWYATEYNEVDGIFFGFVIGVGQERGYFSIHELSEYKGPLGIGIERDAHFTKCSFSELKRRGM